ncbi:Protein-tyrosine phosphatase, partial [Teladorsagia circumcincta]
MMDIEVLITRQTKLRHHFDYKDPVLQDSNMAAKTKRRTTRQRRRLYFDATYEEPDIISGNEAPTPPVPSRPVPTPPQVQVVAKKTSPTYRRPGGGTQVSADVEKHLDSFVDTFTTLGVEGLRKQFREELASYRAPDDKYKFRAFEAHPDKNRYMDVVCLDDTRVRLTLNVPPATDYIHANWVKFEGHDKVFIATQFLEDGKVKCSQYWPMESGKYHTFGKMFVNTKKGDKLDNGPIVMHCSAGIGRTGTIILIDVILRRLFSRKEIDLVDLFKKLRNQRASCIQLEGQYVFVILSVLDYIK